MLLQLKVKILHEEAVIPKYAHDFDSGFDLVAVSDVIIRPGETAKVPTGLAFEIPDGYELQIRPRSGISANTKLRISNAPGTIDAGYRGEVCVLVDNIAENEWVIDDRTFDDPTIVNDNTHWAKDVSGRDVYLGANRYEPCNSYIIRRGDKIAQGVIAPVIRATFDVVDELGETERGGSGFGSTGTN